MPSSISSSDVPGYARQLPSGDWLAAVGAAFAILTLVIVVMECVLAARGFQPTVVDSPRLWAAQRARASELGARAFILLGNSRMQLDIDTATIRSHTGLVPVQLAIDGTSFMPILAGLAKDPSIRGTVLVQFTDPGVLQQATDSRGADMQAAYDHRSPWIFDYISTEDELSDLLHSHLRSSADGSRPITALRERILPPQPTPQYLQILPDRSRKADYTKVTMPDWYFGRAMMNLGEDPRRPGMTFSELYGLLVRRIATIRPEDNRGFVQEFARINAMVDAIQRRGGHVVFAVFPSSGLIKATDDARYPRAMFWNRFALASHAPTLYYDDVASLRGFVCPDGSHLDMRQTAPFTTALVSALGLDVGSTHH